MVICKDRKICGCLLDYLVFLKYSRIDSTKDGSCVTFFHPSPKMKCITSHISALKGSVVA